VLNIHNRLSSE